jgi:NADH-quinone oxidoreductase subunit H
MKLLFNYLIFPGFLFSACIGLMAGWLDRKVSARIQWRVGPPWYQNFIDIIKLLGKETIVPEGAEKLTFLGAPLLGLTAVTLVATMRGIIIISKNDPFLGDMIVALYLLIIPSLAVLIGGSSSKNPLASIGVSREMKLILSYELPFILACIVPIIKTKSILITEIVNFQAINGSLIFSFSGLIAFVVFLFCLPAKLGFAPFDIAEAEQEIMAGPYIEYSGLPLAIFKLTRAMLLFVIPVFIIHLLLGREISWPWLFLKYIFILIIIILIKNTNPRLRIDQAMRFFWGPVTLLALIAVILAMIGY